MHGRSATGMFAKTRWQTVGLTAFFIFAGPSPASADNGYFSWLSGLPEALYAKSYRTQAEIDGDMAARAENRVRPPVYDPKADGAKWTFSGQGIDVRDQLRPSFPATSSGNLLFYWEARWDPAIAAFGDEVHTHKAFQLSNSGDGDERRIELRTRFDLAPSSDIAKVDVRTYIWNPAEQPLSGQVDEFTIRAGEWTSFWAFVDFSRREFSFWVGDDAGRAQLFDARKFSDMSGGLDNFWFEFNSSQSRSGSDVSVWARNFVVLRGVSNADAIVDGLEIVAPDAPTDLRVD